METGKHLSYDIVTVTLPKRGVTRRGKKIETPPPTLLCPFDQQLNNCPQSSVYIYKKKGDKHLFNLFMLSAVFLL